MPLPFTVEQFFDVFAGYHEAVGPMPIVLNGLAILAVGLVFVGGDRGARAIPFILAAL